MRGFPALANKKSLRIWIFALLLFLVLFPLSQKVTFWQNDDWVYHLTVENFYRGNFKLHPQSGAALYSQAFAGYIFGNMFPSLPLSVLTLLVSILCLVVFYLLLRKTKLSAFSSLLITFFLFLNPFFVYSIWGFMTDNYFLLFLVLILYFHFRYTKGNALIDLVLSALFGVVGFFTRQYMIAISFAAAFHLTKVKKYKAALFELGVALSTLAFYYSVFPRTEIMKERYFSLNTFLDFEHIYKNVFVYLVYIGAFLFPLVLYAFVNVLARNKRKMLMNIALALGLLFLIFTPLSPHRFFASSGDLGIVDYKLSRLEFPYLENTFERNGFFPDSLSSGTKVGVIGGRDLFTLWGWVGLASFPMLVIIFLNSINFTNMFFIFFWTYFGITLFGPSFYDRYLLPLIFLAALYLLTVFKESDRSTTFRKPFMLLSCLFTALLLFISYNFSLDFVLLNRYVWEKSKELAKEENVKTDNISGLYAWKKAYGKENILYKFTFDGPNKFEEESVLIEKKNIKFPLSAFKATTVYLYKLKN